jgi:4-amino-4-deoxy-L-arabinose transferase-like glycosyltransferase
MDSWGGETASAGPGEGEGGGNRPLRIGLVLLFVLATLLMRWPGMTEGLWYDEIRRTSMRLNPERWFDALFGDVHNFLYNGFMYVWIRVFGESEISLRLPSLAAGYLSVGVFSVWLARVWNRRLGLCTGAWLLLAPSHLWYSTEAKNVMFTVFFSVLLLVAHERSATTGSRRWRVMAVVATVLAICTDFATLLLLVPAVVCAALDSEGRLSRSRLRVALATSGLGLLLCLPLLVYKAGQLQALSRAYVRHLDLRELFLLLANFFPSGNAILPYSPYHAERGFEAERLLFYLPLGLAVAILLGVGVAALHRRSTREARSSWGGWLSLSLVLPLGVVFCLSALIHLFWPDQGRYLYQERNLLALLYPFAALVSAGVLALRPRVLRLSLLGVVFAIPLLGDALMLSAYRDVWTVYKPNPDWRGAAAWLEARREPGRPLVTLERTPADALSFYAPDVRRIRARRWPPSEERLMRAMRGRGIDEIYLLRNLHWGSPDMAQFAEALPGFQVDPAFSSRGVQIHRLSRKP